MTAPYNYSDQFIRERASSGGKDPGRQRTADELFAQAKAGDPAALLRLQYLSGVKDDPATAAKEGWATADARNYGKMLLGQMGQGYTPQYDQAHDGSFQPLHAIGGVLKVAAPFAGLIPGVGPMIGAGLAAGGSALGGALHGDRFNLLDTALAGGAGYLGGKLNPFGSHAASYGAGATPGLGNMTQSGPGVLGTGAGLPTDPGMSAGGGGGGGFLNTLFGGGGGGILDKALQYGLPILGAAGEAHRQHEADQMMQDAYRQSQAEWLARQPLRDFSQQQILGLPSIQRPDMSKVFADPGNPFYRAN
jgi:hypothetical protein